MKKHLLAILTVFLMTTSFAQDWTRTYSTYFGGYMAENIFASVQDSDGNFFVAGTSRSDNMPVTTGAHQPFFAGGTRDGFIAKFNSENDLIWCTYFGGNGQDVIYGLAVDISGIYFCGQTESDNLTTTPDAHQSSYSANMDAFVGRLAQDGSIDWSTYYGGDGMDSFDDMMVYNGYLYCVGHTWSTDDVTTNNAVQSEINGVGDGLITIFSTSGDVEYSSYFGGNGVDYIQAIDVDAAQNIYISGQTSSTSGLNTDGAYWENIAGGDDAFVAKLSSDYETEWCTYFGGSNNENGKGIALDGSNNIWITGNTGSSDLTTTPDALMTTYADQNGEDDCYILQLNNMGEMMWSTYFGGNSYDGVDELVYGHGRIFFGGYSDSNNMPTTNNALQEEDEQYADCVLAIFNTNHTLEYCTYYGAEGSDFARSLAITADGVAVAGDSGSESFMATPDAYKSMIADGFPDGFYTFFDIENISAIKNMSSDEMTIYPNPAMNQMMITSPSAIYRYDIMDISGRIVRSENALQAKQVIVPTDMLASGTYVVQAFTSQGIYTTKLIKQ